MAEVMSFANALDGTLSLMTGVVVTARLIQYVRTPKNRRVPVIPPKAGDTDKQHRVDRVWLLSMVAILMITETMLAYRSAWSIIHGGWEDTFYLTKVVWFLRSAATLVIVRLFSQHRCGEKGWITFLFVGVIVAYLFASAGVQQ